jgi:Domain of unknown function (DUF4303)
MVVQIPLDRAGLRAAIREAVEAAWGHVRSTAPDEQIYGLAVYEGVEYGSLCVTVFTEEALDRCTAYYRERNPDYEGDAGREGLRWSAPDSEYHCVAGVDGHLVAGEDLFRLWESDREAYDKVAYPRYRAAVYEACIESLQELDRAGHFGRDEDRHRMTLWIIDQNEGESVEDLLRVVATLNPPAVVESYRHWRRFVGI